MTSLSKQCVLTGKSFTLSDRDQAFYDRIKVPYPQICHEERMRRRLVFRNSRNLYKRKCDRTGQSIVSMYSPNAPFPVYHRDEWWKEGWRPPEAEFDFSRPFFEQLLELRNKCPRASVFNKQAYNSDYCNISDGLKDCYMSFTAFLSRNLLYSHRINRCSDLTDCYYCSNSQVCYGCVYCFDSFNLINCVECKNCNDSAFLYDCIASKNCFMSTNLRQKQYYIFNQPHTKEEYEAKMKQIDPGSYVMMQYLAKKFEDFRAANAIHRSNKLDQCDTAEGHRLFNCKDAENCFEVEDGRDITRCVEALMIKDCADSVSFGGIRSTAELGYELQESCDFYNFKFCNFCYSKNDLEYSDECHNGSYLFGCVGLKNESFCILNKKYPEADYHALKAKIIEHMKKTGEYGWFFPPEYSAFAYNESEAQEYFPLEKDEALRLGYRWKDDLPSAEGVAVDSVVIPDHIKQAPLDMGDKVFSCEISGQKYKITSQELAFYQRMNVPIPRRSPNQRHKDRFKERLVVHLYDRPCTKCGVPMRSAYPPDRAVKVYCDPCYFKEIY